LIGLHSNAVVKLTVKLWLRNTWKLSGQ